MPGDAARTLSDDAADLFLQVRDLVAHAAGGVDEERHVERAHRAAGAGHRDGPGIAARGLHGDRAGTLASECGGHREGVARAALTAVVGGEEQEAAIGAGRRGQALALARAHGDLRMARGSPALVGDADGHPAVDRDRRQVGPRRAERRDVAAKEVEVQVVVPVSGGEQAGDPLSLLCHIVVVAEHAGLAIAALATAAPGLAVRAATDGGAAGGLGRRRGRRIATRGCGPGACGRCRVGRRGLAGRGGGAGRAAPPPWTEISCTTPRQRALPPWQRNRRLSAQLWAWMPPPDTANARAGRPVCTQLSRIVAFLIEPLHAEPGRAPEEN